MVSRKQLEDERDRYRRFISSVESKSQQAAAAEKAPLLEQQAKYQSKMKKLGDKVKRNNNIDLSNDQAVINAMSIFQKRNFKKWSLKLKEINDKIEAIDNKYSVISENNTRMAYQAERELNAFFQQNELLENPNQLINFANKLLTDLLAIEQQPAFQTDIRKRWGVMQEVIGELLNTSEQALDGFKNHLQQLIGQNDRQTEDDEFDLDDLALMLPSMQPAQQKSLQDQLDKKSLKIAMRKEFSELLKTMVARIDAQPMVAVQPIVPVSSSSARPQSIRFSEQKLEPIPAASSSTPKPVGKVAKRIQYFEDLDKKNQEREEQSKRPRRK